LPAARRCRRDLQRATVALHILIPALLHEAGSQELAAVADRLKAVSWVCETHAYLFTLRRQGCTCFSLLSRHFVHQKSPTQRIRRIREPP
jgi:hypothetical protein